MRLIQGQPPYPPRACARTNRINGEFVDFQVILDHPEATRLYLLREVVEEAGQLCGMVKGERVHELERDLDALGEDIAALRERLEQVESVENLAEQLEKEFV